MGEDWDGFAAAILISGIQFTASATAWWYSRGIVHMGWGNVIIVRHSYREGGTVKNVDALYGHLNNILVHRGASGGAGSENRSDWGLRMACMMRICIWKSARTLRSG